MGQGSRQGGCGQSCVLFFIIFCFLPIALPIFLMVKLWESDWSLRTKRAITGAVFYPAGAYFLWRYTRYSQQLRLGAIAAALIGTWMMVNVAVIAPAVLLTMMVAFLVLFLMAEQTQPEPVRPARAAAYSAPAPSAPSRPRTLAAGDIPPAELRMLLEIEKARSAEERRLLLAREFGRLAPQVLAFDPESLQSRRDPKRVATLRDEASLLKASAIDPAAQSLPESNPGDPEAARELIKAIHDLERYATQLFTVQVQSDPDLNQIRVLVRERSRLQEHFDDFVARLGDLPSTWLG